MTRRPLAAAAAITAAAALAVPALAAPARTAVLSAATPTYAWEDGPRNSAGSSVANPAPMCSPGLPCDDTLFEIKDAGSLLIKVTSEDIGYRSDMDIYLYKSDASGEPKGEPVAMGETPEPDEQIKAKVQPGFYLLRAAYFSGIDISYKGTATLTPTVTAPAAPGAPAAPAVNQAPKVTVAKVVTARKKLKAFSGTAADDRGVTRVEVGVLQLSGSKCKQLTRRGTLARAANCKAPKLFLPAKGTSTWTLKLRRALPKGRYLVVARAVDADGANAAAQSRFSLR